MYRYTLTVPTVLNDGAPVPQEYLDGVERTLVETFGGVTVGVVQGAWIGLGGTLYREPARRYEVDVDQSGDFDLLHSYAAFLADALAQECVYLTRTPIETWLVAPAATVRAAEEVD